MKRDIAFSDVIFSRINSLFSNFSDVSRSVRNWYVLVPLYLRLGAVTLESRSGRKKRLESWGEFISYWNSPECTRDRIGKALDLSIGRKTVSFSYKRRRISFAFESRDVLGRMLFEILDQFQENEYGSLEVSGKDVVDIGAGLGETAVYFAARGASHIYAFEPFPYAYERARGNVSRNGLGRSVTLINSGCGGTSKTIRISGLEESSPSSTLRDESKGKNVRVVTLSEIVRKYGLSNAALKIDCEGCEYGLILKAEKETLRRFNQIILEYHYGYRSIAKKLRDCGFEVNVDPPRYLYRYPRYATPWREELKMYMGIIHATRI